MTIEKTITVEPSDILAVSFECANCGLAHSVPVNRLDRAEHFIDRQCSACSKESGFSSGTSDYETLLRFASALQQLATTALKGRGLKVKIEIEATP